jgi:hypothetical protein
MGRLDRHTQPHSTTTAALPSSDNGLKKNDNSASDGNTQEHLKTRLLNRATWDLLLRLMEYHQVPETRHETFPSPNTTRNLVKEPYWKSPSIRRTPSILIPTLTPQYPPPADEESILQALGIPYQLDQPIPPPPRFTNADIQAFINHLKPKTPLAMT